MRIRSRSHKGTESLTRHKHGKLESQTRHKAGPTEGYAAAVFC